MINTVRLRSSLFLVDLSSSGNLFDNSATGTIYQIQAVSAAVPWEFSPSLGIILSSILFGSNHLFKAVTARATQKVIK